MPQSDPTDARDTPGSSVSGEKRRKSKNGESSRKRGYNDNTRLANGSTSHVLRRSSISKPGRDGRDEPTIKRQKRERRRRQTVEDGERDAASVNDDGNAEAGAAGALTRLDSPVIDFDGLSRPSVGTRERLEESPEEAAARLDRIKGAVRTLLECVGENPNREGLLATPERYAKAMMFFTRGYEQNVLDIVNGAIFQEGHSEMVIVKDVDIFSVCEHHLVPFTGKMHIGYIPNNAVIGISKLPRIAEMFARRLQIQERLTKEVANAIFEVLRPQGVAVVMQSSHLCMVMRGVQKTSSTTVTSCMLGCFERRDKTRNEFLSLINVNSS
ncbi:GTP cyclohydrolase 1 [Tolypocladium capitatum]|uniref:GTP cyclohydrolase 1 n=1 Tax=Tolypocladium capitatum TaxID=45235 RepID=A0A2K3QNS7_9HYPO|nr:GTP cyclohydrolase 1 [Tolypocladium capitatum]